MSSETTYSVEVGREAGGTNGEIVFGQRPGNK